MDKKSLVNIPFFQGHLDDIDNELISHQITQYGEPCGDEEEPWDDQDILLPDTPEINELLTRMTRLVQYGAENNDLILKNQWALNLQHGKSVGPHSHHANFHIHPEDYWSAVYYPIADEKSAKLILSATWCNTVHRNTHVQPQSGMYVIFPSYVLHWTERQQSPETRLVIGANFDPAEPNMNANVDFSIYERRPSVDPA
jgi:hypothetical protein